MSTTGRVDSAYTAYGHRKDQPLNGSAIGFNGQFLEEGIDGYALGNGTRIYSPLLMKFHSPDNYGVYGEAGFNQYAYCFGNPNDFTDPSGNVPFGLGWVSKLVSRVSKLLKPKNVAAGVKRGSRDSLDESVLKPAKKGTGADVVAKPTAKTTAVTSKISKSVPAKPGNKRGGFWEGVNSGEIQVKYTTQGTGPGVPGRSPVTGAKFGESLGNPPSGLEQWNSQSVASDSMFRSTKQVLTGNWSRSEEEMKAIRSHFVPAKK
ncbi:RHS repeat-associated core domain-containing protein [Pseudomonas sp. G(2018)]|uniref:RHS repeat-associated core domain-containing protein n=1 Tax=Pseudomonas sp. G(2018) TaxID=2502242 RepID=UPI001485A764|nr:RHS repeat-associated core domain-containing protein [Pseudomonas sp. G(2018)]